jgi:hypothetical protein
MATFSKRIAIRLLWVGLVVGLFAGAQPIYVFGVTFGLWQPWTRPPSVTRRARYVSRIEDGTWFDCSVDSKRDVDVCKAWDSYGRALADGDFRLECQERAATASELRPSSVVSGGGRAYMIYLFGTQGAQSRALVPAAGGSPAPCPRVTVTY